MHRNAFYVIYFSSIQEVTLEKEDGALQFLRLVCKLSIKPHSHFFYGFFRPRQCDGDDGKP